MKKLEELPPEGMPVLTITVDVNGKAWLQEFDGMPKQMAVDFTIENEIERDEDAEFANGGIYRCMKPTGKHTLTLTGVWWDKKEPAR